MQAAHAQPGRRRFVVLRHEGTADYKPGVHWDLMLESGQSLRTWALAELPTADRGVEAEQLPDHRLAYLDYEGPISGDRGSVSRWDQGEFEVVAESEYEWIVSLAGRRLHGQLSLSRRAGGSLWDCAFQPAG
jgi:hypothetical protein